MKSIQFIGLSPEEFKQELREEFLKLIATSQKKETISQEEYLTRKEVAELFKVNLSTLHLWCKSGKLKSFGIGNRVYFKRSDIEESLIKLS